MESTFEESYRGWEIKVFSREDGTFTAIFENEHSRYELPEDVRPVDADTCIKKVQRCIDMYDSFDPQFRSAAYKNVEPRPYEAWLIGEEPD